MGLNKENYRRLGDYIREVNVRNTDLSVTNLVGLTIDKAFIPSVANTIGTDLSKYKVIRQKQFACSLMQVSRDQKIPIAMFPDQEAIMSPAYPMFEVIDKSILLPEYLMMWCSRKEFDREASFYAVGGVRGSLTWEDFLDMKFPIPSIEQQRKIVSDYESLSRRIRLNEQMIQKLEDTAQTLYKKMFVNGIDKKKLPEGWKIAKIGDFCEFNIENLSKKDDYATIKYLDVNSVSENVISDYQILNLKTDEIPSRAKRKIKYNDIVYSTVRPNLKHFGIIKSHDENIIASTAFCVIHSVTNFVSNELLYLWLTTKENTDFLQGIAEMSKATYPSITPNDLAKLQIVIPSIIGQDIITLNRSLERIFNRIALKQKEIACIEALRTVYVKKIFLTV